MAKTTQGKRRPDDTPPHKLKPGDYGQWNGIWYGMVPVDPLLAILSNHDVVEHEDGTITASPSIKCDRGDISWHGFLERGVWREC